MSKSDTDVFVSPRFDGEELHDNLSEFIDEIIAGGQLSAQRQMELCALAQNLYVAGLLEGMRYAEREPR